MFGIGDKIVYGYDGVFYVSEYANSPIDKNDKRVFYVLRPAFGSASNIIVTPSEGGATSMRAVMTAEEATELIARVGEIAEVEVEKERNRREIYREVMNQCRAEDFVSIIKTVRRRRGEFIAQKRRLSETDTDFESRARHCLFCELAVSMNTTVAEAEQVILAKLAEA